MAKRMRDPAGRELRRARRALSDATTAIVAIAGLLPGLGKTASKSAKLKRRTPVSPKRLAQLKLHGAYIGRLRHLKPRQRAEVKAVKAKKGYEAAIRMAKRFS